MTLIALHIDALIQRCGWFTSATDVNGGYGCNHPEQRECEGGQGRCHTSSCPVASCFDDFDDPHVVAAAAKYGITPDCCSPQEWMEWDPEDHAGNVKGGVVARRLAVELAA